MRTRIGAKIGTIKRWFGCSHFLPKGLAKVRGEWSLTALAYNLKGVLNLVSFGKLMAMVNGKTSALMALKTLHSITVRKFSHRLARG